MVIQTVLDRFREGRRLNNSELNELLEAEPGLQDQVVASLSDRYLTRRSLRQLIEQVPGLRVDLGTRLLEQEPRVLDVLEVLQDVPELRELGLQAIRTGEFSPKQVLRVARRNPRLREAAIDAVLADDHTRERIVEVIQRLPGSEAMLLERLEALGLEQAELDALLAAVPELQNPAASERGPRSQEWRVPPTREPQPTREPVVSDLDGPDAGGRPGDVLPDQPPPSLPQAPPPAPAEPAPVASEEAPATDSGLLPGHERRAQSSEGAPAQDEVTPSGRPDPWRDTEPLPVDDIDRRWGRGR